MKQKFTFLILAYSIFLLSSISIAGALKPDCTVKKAGKNTAIKATIGVGGRCSPADAAKDSAKDVAGIEGNEKTKEKTRARIIRIHLRVKKTMEKVC